MDEAFGDVDGGSLECKADSTTGAGIVGVGDGTRNEIAAEVGGVELPFAVVAAAAHGGEERVAETVAEPSVAEPEVARVVMKDGGKDSFAPELAVEVVGVGRTEALGVAGEAGTVLGELVALLFERRVECGGGEVEKVDAVGEGEAELLAGGERDGLAVQKRR